MNVLNVSVDRITFVGGISDRRLLDELRFNPFVKGQGRAKYPYDYTWYMMDGSVLQLAPPNGDVRPLRYDFNPNNWDVKSNKDYHVMSVLKCMKSVVPTRIDIAIDILDLDLGKFKWLDTEARKREVHFDGSGRTETIYIGSERSDVRFRIYNKAKERTDKEKVTKHKVWWRVEVQLRGEKAEKFLEINPFSEIIALHTTTGDGVADYDLKTRAMLHYLTEFPAHINELSSHSKVKYRQLLNATTERVSENSFADIYESNKEKVRDTIDTFRHLTMDNFNWKSTSTEDIEYVEQLKKEIIQLKDDQE